MNFENEVFGLAEIRINEGQYCTTSTVKPVMTNERPLFFLGTESQQYILFDRK